MIGDRFGRLTIMDLYRKDTIYGLIKFCLCKCDCGNQIERRASELTRKKGLKSCGCLKSEMVKEKNKSRAIHMLTGSRIYRIHKGMIFRCYNKNCKDYGLYGGRGIKVCDEWLNNFQSFYNWSMENGYSNELSIDRINVNGNYEPSNCRWATAREQALNRRKRVSK